MSAADALDPRGRAPTWYRSRVADLAPRPPLLEDLRVEVAIVGGGHTGVATALELAERGVSVALLEATRIGDGATGRNGGQVTGSLSGQAAFERQLGRQFGNDAADAFVQRLRWSGQTLIRERVARHGIDCALTSGHLHTAWRPRDAAGLKEDLAAAERAGLGDRVRWLERDELHAILDTPLYHGAVRNDHNLHLNSLKLCLGEAAAAESLGARLFEGTPVLRVECAVHGRPAAALTADARVGADTIVLAGNAYHRLYRHQLAGLMFPAVLANLVTEPIDEELRTALNPHDLAVYDSRTVLDYHRFTEDGRLLFGGGTNYSGRDFADADAVARALRPRLEATFPRLAGVAIEHAWTGLAGIVPNRLPLVGRLEPGILHAQGYSGHGIATSHLLARALATALTGGDSRDFDALASLHHHRLPGGQLALALGMALAVGSDHAKTLISRVFER